MPLEPYDEEEELATIRRRYERVESAIPYTLVMLKENQNFRVLVKDLQDQLQLKEWHILQAIVNGVVNWRISLSRTSLGRLDASEIRTLFFERWEELFNNPEQEHQANIPPEHFSQQALEGWLLGGVMDFLAAKGAEFRPRVYDLPGLLRVAENRYNYLSLDIPHDPLFES